MRKRKDIEKEFRKKCSKLSKSDMNSKNMEAQKLILEALLDVRELLQEFDLEDYMDEAEPEYDDCDIKIGVTEEEIITLYEEKCHDK